MPVTRVRRRHALLDLTCGLSDCFARWAVARSAEGSSKLRGVLFFARRDSFAHVAGLSRQELTLKDRLGASPQIRVAGAQSVHELAWAFGRKRFQVNRPVRCL